MPKTLTIRVEKKTRAAEDPELIARAAAQKQKKSEKQRHYYSAKKQLLYEAKAREGRGGEETGGGDGLAAAAVVVKKRGRPRETAHPTDDGDKENVDPGTGTAVVDSKKIKYSRQLTAVVS